MTSPETMAWNNTSGLGHIAEVGVGTYVTIMCTLSLFGNVTVLAVKIKNRKQLKSHDYFIINIAIADIGAVTTGYLLMVVSASNHMLYFVSSECTLVGFSGWFFNCVSMTTLSVIAIMRYLIVVRSQGSFFEKKKRIIGIIVFIWLYSAFWATAPLVGWDRYVPEPYLSSCSLDWTSTQPADIAYIVCIFVWCFLLCVIAIIFSYGSIILKVRQIQRNLNPNKSAMKKHGKITKMFAITTICFLVSWTPYAIVSFVSVIKGSSADIPLIVLTSPNLFAKFSCVYNPIVYYTTDKMFRKSVNQLFWSICLPCCEYHITSDVQPQDLTLHADAAHTSMQGRCQDKVEQPCNRLPLPNDSEVVIVQESRFQHDNTIHAS
ncbi:opsin-5-like [Saccoglossus kowalevskii]|uniref:Opsin-5-like n=1 Tax=Saccoglossus kowalevskii TaxID=10224 RepID=A0ABM0MIA3_SACKO|nr:PREDICTED: opsin-5-like [Saccoglossus kowalevskii]